MLRGELLNAEGVKRRTAERGARLVTALTERITRLTLKLLRKVKMDKLTGQALNVRSGRLRRSINSRMEGGGTPQVAGTVGTNVRYARPHEFGFHDTVTVKQHLRMQVKAWGRDIEPKQVVVSSHQVTMNLPERSFLRSALTEMGGEIRHEISKAVTESGK